MLLGYWLYFVAPLVPLKAVLFSGSKASAPVTPTGEEQEGKAPTYGAADKDAPAVSPTNSKESEVAPTGPLSLFRPLRSSDAALAATGIVAGFASGLLGIGGGTIVTPALALFTGMGQVQVGFRWPPCQGRLVCLLFLSMSGCEVITTASGTA
jgi:hypothetical protein